MVPAGTLVHTRNGLVPIEKVKTGTYVHTSDGLYQTNEVLYQGKQEVLTFETELGLFECTPCQHVYTYNNGWKMAKYLTVLDKLSCPLHVIKIDYDMVNNAWAIGYIDGGGDPAGHFVADMYDRFRLSRSYKVPDRILTGTGQTRLSYINGYRTGGAPLTVDVHALISSIGAVIIENKIEWPCPVNIPIHIQSIQNTGKVCETWTISSEYIVAQGFLVSGY